MGKKIKKIFSKIADALNFIFKGPASNQIRVSKTQPGKFTSYSQLKRYQRHFRKVTFQLFAAAFFIFVGVLFGPIVFQKQFQSEIYIPDGKGDILIANVSKNQATVIFKTFDQKHNNKPLATSAMVEVYLDPEFRILYKRTDIFEYAVTHIIPLNGLGEGKTYYLKVLASESGDMSGPKEVSRWAGKDPISFYTSGETFSGCEVSQNADRAIAEQKETEENSQKIDASVSVAPSSEDFVSPVQNGHENESLKIGIVQSENHLYSKDRIQTIISWDTNLPSDSTIIYRSEKESNDTEVRKGSEFVKRHAVTLTILKPETVYYYKVKSKSQNGEEAVSSEYSMRTPKAKQTIMEMLGENLKSLFGR